MSETVVQTTPMTPDAAAKQKTVENLVKKMPGRGQAMGKNAVTLAIATVVILAGIGTGWVLSGPSKASQMPPSGQVTTDASGKQQAGIADTGDFKDCAEGVMKEGGIKGEGTYHLDRDLGEEKFVYLTSTAVDLGSFLDKKVQVCGETIQAKYAGWLMDVVRVKSL